MVSTPRMSKSYQHDDSQMVRYQALQELVLKDGGYALDLNCHRYKAVANRICVGYFSSLKLAFGEVDDAFPLHGTTWEQTVEPADFINYVLDVVANRTFVRVAVQKKVQGA